MPPSIVSYGHLVFVVYDLESVGSAMPVTFYSDIICVVSHSQSSGSMYLCHKTESVDCEITRNWLKSVR